MRTTLLLSAFVLAATSLGAQEPPTLTLDEALAIARERNPGYLRAQANVRARSLDVRQSYGAFLPSLSASMGWSGNSSTQLTGEGDFGQTERLDDPLTVKSSGANQSISTSLTLFDGFNNVNSLRAARQSVFAEQAAVADLGLDIDLQVAQQFYQALQEERLLAVEEQLLASAGERLDANRRMFRVAAATQVDVLGAETDLAQSQQQLERQQGTARKARLQLLQTLGVLGEIGDARLVGEFPEPFDPTSLEAGQLVERALAAHPRIRQGEAAADATGMRATAAKGQWLPRASFNAGWGRSLRQDGFGAVFDVNPNANRGWNFGIQLSWEVFNGFSRSQQIGQSNIAHGQALEDLRATELEVEQQVRAAFIDLESAYQSLLVQQRVTELSRQRLEMAQEQFRTGASGMTFTSLQQIIDQASNQERALVQATAAFAIALATLERRVGEPVRP